MGSSFKPLIRLVVLANATEIRFVRVQPEIIRVACIDYPPENIVREVFDYFKTAESDSAEFALLELGENDYTLDDIRLMRLKFISELGN